jgi:C4-dicarboxylate-specific signal transduction histidine kinase
MLNAVAFGLLATVSVPSLAWLSTAVRRELDAAEGQMATEERIADNVMRWTDVEQLAAYRYLDHPSAANLADFHDRGQRVSAGIRDYALRELPAVARFQIDTIDEVHQEFERAAQQAFELLARGDAVAARARIGEIADRANAFEEAVRRILAERERQRSVLRVDQERALRGLQLATVVVALVLALTAVLLAQLLRRRVMLPLDDLSIAVRQLGDGNEHVRVAPQRYQEFQDLADSFDRMADSIRESRDAVQASNRDLSRTLDDLRRAQQELVQHEKLRAMGEMLAGLAHELNNPLAGILGLAECIKLDLTDLNNPIAQELVSSMVDPLVVESLRARDLVRNLMHFARQSTEQLGIVQLSEAVDVAIGLRRHSFAQDEKTIDIDVANNLYVVAEAQKLQHAILNIANNALDALRDGGGTRLHVFAVPDDRFVSLVFADDGPGFHQPDRAFDPFYTTKPVGSGTGLGLSLVHRFVQEFGGTVSAANGEGGGARVTMRLRAAPRAAT